MRGLRCAGLVWGKERSPQWSIENLLWWGNRKNRTLPPVNIARLRGRKVCAFVLRKGAVWRGRTVVIRWLWGLPRGAKDHRGGGTSVLLVGTCAPRSLDHSAVKRNRMRRRCREALRITVRDFPHSPSAQLLLCPRSASLHAPFHDMCTDVRTFFSSLSACHPNERNSRSS